MYARRTRQVKTDRRDARARADACVLGAYRRAHRLSDPQRHVRGRLLVRDAIVRTRTRYISLMRALLRQPGDRVPSGRAEAFVPRKFSSGDGQHRGAITKAGPGRTRWLLIQAAVSIFRRRPPQADALRAGALGIAARRGQPIAVVALARPRAGILDALLRDGTVFTPRRPSPPVAAVTLPGGVPV